MSERPISEWEPPAAPAVQTQPESFEEKVGAIIVLLLVATACALVLHWAGVI